MINDIQLESIKNKVLSTDYCKITDDDLQAFIAEHNVKLGNRKTKQAIFKLICSEETLVNALAEKFFDKILITEHEITSIYELTSSHFEELEKADLFEKSSYKDRWSRNYYNLNSLKHTKDEMQLLVQDLEKELIRVTIDVNKERVENGDRIITLLENTFSTQSGYVTKYSSKDRLEHCITIRTTEIDEIKQARKLRCQIKNYKTSLNANRASDLALDQFILAYQRVVAENEELKAKITALEKSSKRRPSIGLEKEHRIAELREQGYSMRKIAKEVGVAEGTVVNVLRRKQEGVVTVDDEIAKAVAERVSRLQIFSHHNKETKNCIYTHDCMNASNYHIEKTKHWCKLIKTIDLKQTGGYAFVGDFLQVRSENRIPNGSYVVETCNGYYTLYYVTTEGKSCLLRSTYSNLCTFIDVSYNIIKESLKTKQEVEQYLNKKD